MKEQRKAFVFECVNNNTGEVCVKDLIYYNYKTAQKEFIKYYTKYFGDDLTWYTVSVKEYSLKEYEKMIIDEIRYLAQDLSIRTDDCRGSAADYIGKLLDKYKKALASE